MDEALRLEQDQAGPGVEGLGAQAEAVFPLFESPVQLSANCDCVSVLNRK